MKKFSAFLLSALVMLPLTAAPVCAAQGLPGIVSVTDTVLPDTGKDVSAELQRIIDENPNRTIWFPDGEYIVSTSLLTPADPKKSVDLQLSNYAVIKASDDFSGGAVIRLGGKDAYNTTAVNGSNYSLTGGIIDGNGIADGISIDSGRETKIQNTSVKHTVTGIHIAYGANSGSSDADIRDVNIIGNGTKEAVGMLIEGYDNTFTNIRIGYVYTGVIMRSGGNALTNIHPLYQIGWANSPGSCGFVDENGNNLYTYCYSDQFETAFRLSGGRNIFTDCFCFWWSGDGKKCVGVEETGSSFNSVFTNFRIDFRGDTDNTVYDGPIRGKGAFNNLLVEESNLNADIRYKTFTDDGAASPFRTFFAKVKSFFVTIINFFEQLFKK